MSYPLLEQQIPKRIQQVWRKTIFVTSLSCFILLAASIAAVLYFDFWHHFLGLGFAILAVVIVSATVFSWLLVPYRYAYHRYKVSTQELAFQKGYFFRSTTFVPMNRIQHVETQQGPFLRKENLMEVVIHTAATTHRLPGVDLAEAQKLRAEIISFVKVAKADE